ncbi:MULTISPECIES: trypsin-like peptidase domain-containing protein [Vagococcus]|uniref:trypsin-like serine peptidase n=1 Tax=Vagococcus TaxID=2737 RepID=UPI0028903126|nr:MULTISPECIES: hypothetical protein [Vagococcus]MDT2832149.1 hypothetical protein [Vagococcus carniphilus]MDT2840983.1 hypothetical protein [Vagococcus carniphilus]MDT2855594.1 hypothetical protein [Vagococcus carniphilus]WNF91550.1 hypothetical protein QDW48_14050 [Vagococcus fluvialis]
MKIKKSYGFISILATILFIFMSVLKVEAFELPNLNDLKEVKSEETFNREASLNTISEPIEFTSNIDYITFQKNRIETLYNQVYHSLNRHNNEIEFINSETGEIMDIVEALGGGSIITPRSLIAVDATTSPFNSTAQINSYYFMPNNQVKVSYGSGFYTGGKNVSTAGHVIYNPKNGGFPTYSSVAFGRRGPNTYSWYVESNSFSTIQAYINNPTISMADIGKIKNINMAATNVPARSMRYETDSSSTHKVTNFGYPGTHFLQYATDGTAKMLFDNSQQNGMFKSTNIRSLAGMSGGPLNKDGKIIGLLSGGNDTVDYFVPMYPAYMDFFKTN